MKEAFLKEMSITNMKGKQIKMKNINNIRKGHILYNGMVRGRRKFLVINIILTVLYVLYMMRAMPFIVGKLHGPYDFDSDKFIRSTQTITLDKEIVMKKRADKSIPSYAFFDTSYHDDNKYRFNVKFDDFEDIGVKYTTQLEDPKTKEMIEYVLYTVYMGKIGDIHIPVLHYGEEKPVSNTILSGIFVQPADVIKSDISKLTSGGSTVTMNEFMFDSRNLEMEIENTDVAIMIFGFALLLFLYIRVLRYYVNPYKHPTYKQLYKYGELEELIDEIENQFESDEIFMEGKELISTDWIMTKDTFKNKIVKNHRTRGRYS